MVALPEHRHGHGGETVPEVHPAAGKPGTAPKRGRWRGIVSMTTLTVLVLAAGVAGNKWLLATKPPVARQPVVEHPKPVRATSAHWSGVAPVLSAFGQITAARTVDLRGHVTGEIVDVGPHFVEGGVVAEGELLLKIDSFVYEGALIKAKAELAEAEARVAEITARIAAEEDAARRAREQRDIADRDLERVSGLANRGNASAADRDSARNRLLAAIAAVETRENQIPIYQAQSRRETASLDRLRFAVSNAARDLERTTLSAPFAGVLSNIAAERGKVINATDRVASLVDNGRLDVKFTLSDGDYGRFLDGGHQLRGVGARVVWKGGSMDVSMPATIDRIAPVITSGTGGIDVYARMDSAEDARRLRPGAFVEVRLDGPIMDRVLRLPQSAVFPGGVVYLIDDDSRLRPVTVTTAGYEDDDMFVRGDIAQGARVMVTRLSEAGPGLLVAVDGSPLQP